MQIKADWISDARVQKVMRALSDARHQAYFVGGCVRNALLNMPATDIDISTNALPETVLALGEKSGFKSLPTGIDHGTVTWVVDDHPFEITTYRRDVETSGRRAVVAFSGTIKDDAMRRDFTMNALYADASGIVVDPLGGLDDLLQRRLRFIGDPADRIKEDYLRILRFFRFFAYYANQEDGFDADGLAACAQHAEGLDILSKERVTQEMVKLLSADAPLQALAAMAQTGVLARVLPGADVALLGPYLENEMSRDWLGRLFVMAGATAQDHLRLSKNEVRQLSKLAHAQDDLTSLHEIAYRQGAANAKIIGAFRESVAPTGHWNADRSAMLDSAAQQVFPLKSQDFNGLEGKVLGDALRKAEDDWIASKFTLTKNALLAGYK
ncbi:MAG: CCA tRNA nucleotidyltransferase [Pseudomonadota bacterium]